jgi:PPM family protein phosphatase
LIGTDFSVVSRSNVGRVRKNNEDSFLVDEALGLFVVCDGMGGHAAGEVASKLACEVLQREIAEAVKLREKFIQTGKPADIKALKKAVEAAIATACKEIFKRASREPDTAGMGTTCTMMLLAGHNKGILGQVGDSRLFVSRGGHLHQLSEDHTYVNELLKRGAITKEQAKNHPQGNVLSRALGVQPSVNVDTMIFDMDPGDTYLLCSDGMYNYFPDSNELGPILAGTDLTAALADLEKKALDRGGHDNVTGVVVRVGGAVTAAEQNLAAEQRIAVLKRIPIFANLAYTELVKVLGLTQLARTPAGQVIVEEGEQGDEFFVVLSGEVDIHKGGQLLTTLRAGAHIGEMAMVDSAPRSATVRAKTDVNLLVMRREEFFGLIRSEPVVASKLLWSFVQVLSGRLRETNEALQGARQELAQSNEFEVFVEEDN